MAKKQRTQSENGMNGHGLSAGVDEMLLSALERGDDSYETGRYLVTFKENAVDEGIRSLEAQGMRVADARDTEGQAASLEDAGDADSFVLPEIGVAIIAGDAVQERAMSDAEIASDSPILAIEPETFMFVQDVPEEYMAGMGRAAESNPSEYLRGFLRAAETIARDLRVSGQPQTEVEEEVLVAGATWGLIACRVPSSPRSGNGIRVAVLDTGMDLGHPHFAGRLFTSQTFVGQPVQDLHSHGTHVIGTACGPMAPPGSTPRYGIAHRSSIFVGKVLSNAGGSVGGSILTGMNWAVANRCTVINMSLGGAGGPFAAYTAAGQAALNNGLLMIAAACNNAAPTFAPANSPTIMSVASLNASLQPSAFSNRGKIEIAAPGENVLSAMPRPRLTGFKTGTSMAAPHVAGCAALWAQVSPNFRGLALWRQLERTARPLPFPRSRVGAGLVQAPQA